MTIFSKEEISLLYYNISYYYVFSVILSFFTILLTIYVKYKNKNNIIPILDVLEDDCFVPSIKFLNLPSEDLMESADKVIFSVKQIQKQQKNLNFRQLTKKELQEEKKAENEQLNAIFNLLKEQQEKFHVNSMEELKDQLKLYR